MGQDEGEIQIKSSFLSANYWNVDTKSINDKELNGKVLKMGKMNKAMPPFVQNLKKRLAGRESPEQFLRGSWPLMRWEF